MGVAAVGFSIASTLDQKIGHLKSNLQLVCYGLGPQAKTGKQLKNWCVCNMRVHRSMLGEHEVFRELALFDFKTIHTTVPNA